MAIHLDPDGFDELKVVVGRRLRASRKAAMLSEEVAAKALGHANVTQISLAEKGERMPPLLSLIKLADLYAVPLDFIVGRINDPIAEEGEQREGIMALAMRQGLLHCFNRFAECVSQQAAIVFGGQREDRADLKTIIVASTEAKAALANIRRLNPNFDEEIRGGAKLETALNKVYAVSDRVAARIETERLQLETVDKALNIEEAETRIKQFALVFSS